MNMMNHLRSRFDFANLINHSHGLILFIVLVVSINHRSVEDFGKPDLLPLREALHCRNTLLHQTECMLNDNEDFK